jgi:hypothetical protein
MDIQVSHFHTKNEESMNKARIQWDDVVLESFQLEVRGAKEAVDMGVQQHLSDNMRLLLAEARSVPGHNPPTKHPSKSAISNTIVPIAEYTSWSSFVGIYPQRRRFLDNEISS